MIKVACLELEIFHISLLPIRTSGKQNVLPVNEHIATTHEITALASKTTVCKHNSSSSD